MTIIFHKKEHLNKALTFILIEFKAHQPNAPKPQKFKEAVATSMGKGSYAALIADIENVGVELPMRDSMFTSGDISFDAIIKSNGMSQFGKPKPEQFIDKLHVMLNDNGCKFTSTAIRNLFQKGIENLLNSGPLDEDEALYNAALESAKDNINSGPVDPDEILYDAAVLAAQEKYNAV